MNAAAHKVGIALAFGAAALLPSRAFAETDAEVQAKLVALTQELMDALIPGKAEPWQRILADDAIIVDEFGRIQDKSEAVKSIHAFPQGITGSIEIRDPKVLVHGNAAVLKGEFYERETVFGQQFLVRYIFCNTFSRRDGVWRLIASMDVTLPTEPSTGSSSATTRARTHMVRAVRSRSRLTTAPCTTRQDPAARTHRSTRSRKTFS